MPFGFLRLMSACPPWCNGRDEVTERMQLVHRSDPIPVPAVERVADDDGGFGSAATVDLIVGLERVDSETWVWIGPEEDVRRSLVLTEESARRLCHALIALLDREPRP
ncbi:hypothetical protein [Microbacterium sp. SORGH_AS_0888]|uniref:hypothetical protein n=1 Tax=Microbacterium sp. SORGH_AS_0888 TaxID=3041791 RepID=UPI00277EB355|nr:hypothetical protein [Microbacterium sp. SORGH_AS_0888]MDQ1131156.1 hypothetical protein [Microbacterium sp. SORGH_AS_0888]